MMLTVPSIFTQPARASGADDDNALPSVFSILYSVQITLNNRYWDTSDECRSCQVGLDNGDRSWQGRIIPLWLPDEGCQAGALLLLAARPHCSSRLRGPTYL